MVQKLWRFEKGGMTDKLQGGNRRLIDTGAISTVISIRPGSSQLDNRDMMYFGELVPSMDVCGRPVFTENCHPNGHRNSGIISVSSVIS